MPKPTGPLFSTIRGSGEASQQTHLFHFILHYHHYNCYHFLINIHNSSSFLFKPSGLMTPKWPGCKTFNDWDIEKELEIMIKVFISLLTNPGCRQMKKIKLSSHLQQERGSARMVDRDVDSWGITNVSRSLLIQCLSLNSTPSLAICKCFYFPNLPTSSLTSTQHPAKGRWKTERARALKNV